MQHTSPRVNILGVRINAISLSEAVGEMASWIDSRSRHYVNICTVHTVMECNQNPTLRNIVNNSGISTPDGMPLVWLCRYHGYSYVTRVYGPDLMLALCRHSISRGYKHFFYGGADGVAQELAIELEKRYPGLQVTGTHSPPFSEAGEMEDPEVIERINSTTPDVVWVGLGTPKQDYWVARHRPYLNASVLIAVGAAFDFHTGRVKQAPEWMMRTGLEWLFRFCMEPRRLWRRYLYNNPRFLGLIAMQLLKLRDFKG